VLADLALDLSAFGAYDVYPRRLGDLFKGSQLVVMGRYRTPKEAAITLTGSFNGKKTAYEYRATASAESKSFDFVPRLWAIRKVGYLMEEIRLHGEKPELKDEIVVLGKKYGIVTPYTSYLVVEDTPIARPDLPRPPPRPRDDMPWTSGARTDSRGSARSFDAARAEPMPKAPAAAAPSEDFDKAFGGAMEKKKLDESGGAEGIAASKAVRRMKEEESASSVTEPVRQASGRTFLYRSGGWVDAAVTPGGKELKVKYLSEAYFALLKARPELKAALALSDRLVISLSAGKRVVIDPNAGETKVDVLTAFLK
jgi:Ca-activated chloride channel homolog